MIRRSSGGVALVTGAASGIGRALSEALAREDLHVVLTDRDAEGLQREAAALADAGLDVEPRDLDVTDSEAFEAVVAETFDRRGRLDLLFNNAGVGVGATVEHHALEDWATVLDVNLGGVVHGVHAAYPRMIRQGFGHIVNTASVAGLVPTGLMVSYTASKHAVVGLSLGLRIEAAEHGVDVTALCPGIVRTSIFEGGRYGRLGDELDRAAVRDAWNRTRPIEPRPFADRVLRRLRKAPAILIVPGRYRLLFWLQRAAPGLSAVLHGRLYRWATARLAAGDR